jgi:hypothetical protein
MNNIGIEILEYSYWEHFKALKDISLILPLNHPKRKKFEKTTNEILKELQDLKKLNDSKINKHK